VIRINLLPKRRRRRLIPESGVVLVAILVIGPLAAAYVWGLWRNREMAAQTAEINNRLVVVRRQVSEVLTLETQIEDLKARRNLLQSLEAREVPWSEMLVDLAQRTPKDAWLASASVSSGSSLSLDGGALSYNAVARFMTTLEASRFYDGVDLQSAERANVDTKPVVEFGLTLSMRPLPRITPAAATPAPADPSR
jgi:Tfp pilus assembly protein PilN